MKTVKRTELSMRLHPSIGNGDNRYIIVDTQEHETGTFHELECVWFCGREDLGDQIFCDAEGERIWMCEHHTRHMHKEKVEVIVD